MKSFFVRKFSIAIALAYVLLNSTLSMAVETIDVLALYSDSATTVSQGQDIPAKVGAFIEYANQAYKNSDVNIRLRTVKIEKISFSGDSGVSSTALTTLQRNQQVAQLRDQYGADMVVLFTLRQPYGGGGFICGIGYVPYGTNGQFYSNAKSAMFSVSAINCGNTTPVHEFGHNMGLGHSAAQGSSGGIYSWARGHGEYNNFATIMAYPSAYGRASRVQQFSSPDQVKCKGRPCGVHRSQADGADAVANLNEVAKQIADFLPTKVTDSSTGGNGGDDGSNGGGGEPEPEDPPTKPENNNLVTDGSFDKLDAWEAFFNTATLEQTTQRVASSHGLLVRDRKAYYAGPVQSLSLTRGETYSFSAYAALDTSFSARSSVVAALLINTDSGYRFQLLGVASVVKGQWSQFGSNFTFNPNGNVRNVRLLIYGPPRGYNVLLDEVEVKVAQ